MIAGIANLNQIKKVLSAKVDEVTPRYSFTVAKQLIFDCAVELYHGTSKLSNEEIGNKLMDVLYELDKFRIG